MNKPRIFGIRNCDSVRKARKWLESKDIDYEFHDFRAEGLANKDLQAWIKAAGWETLLNRRGTSWRQLPEKDRQSVDQAKALKLMLANPTLVKRPVLVSGKHIEVGFDPDNYKAIFNKR